MDTQPGALTPTYYYSYFVIDRAIVLVVRAMLPCGVVVSTTGTCLVRHHTCRAIATVWIQAYMGLMQKLDSGLDYGLIFGLGFGLIRLQVTTISNRVPPVSCL